MSSATPADGMKELSAIFAAGDYAKGLSAIESFVKSRSDFASLHCCSRLLSEPVLKQLGFPKIRIAVVATSTIKHFVEILRLYLAFERFYAEFYVPEYNTLEQSLLAPQSDLYAFKADIIWMFNTQRDIKQLPSPGMAQADIELRLEEQLSQLTQLWAAVQAHSKAFIIQNNFDIPLERPFGNFEANVAWSPISYLRQLNLSLLSCLNGGVSIFDLDFISSLFGKIHWVDERFWYQSKLAFSFEALGLLASHAAKHIASIKGAAKKCLVVDLDHTLWGGVIGDDGLEGIELGSGTKGEAYVAFQMYLLELKNRGIILAVSSKNDETNAQLPFLKHPDMRLSLGDIAVFKANWNNKANSISEIAAELGFGLDSIVFVDDNQAERELVRMLLPEVTVVDLPEDPAGYVRALDSLGLFETSTFSKEDAKRTEMYQHKLQQSQARQSFTDLSAYLRSLEMKGSAQDFDVLQLSRIVQLINKSNQFNLTTRRYTEAEVLALMREPHLVCRCYKMSDRFGDSGLISIVILRKGEKLEIEAWLMSCRVLLRGMEEFVLNDIVNIARQAGLTQIVGRYIPSKKNSLVKDHYQKLGFQAAEVSLDGQSTWLLEVSAQLQARQVFIAEEGAKA